MQNGKTRYREIADILKGEVDARDIPDGSPLFLVNLRKRFNASEGTVRESVRLMKSEGRAVKKVVEGNIRYFAKFPESPQGGSPEKG